MNNTNGGQKKQRQNSIMTPAMRREEQARKLNAQKKAAGNSDKSAANSKPLPQKSAQINHNSGRQKSGVAPSNARVQSNGKPVTKASATPTERQISAHRQKLMQQQRELETLQRQLAQERKKQQRVSRLSALERQLKNQKAINASYANSADDGIPLFIKAYGKPIAAVIAAVLVISIIAAFAKINKSDFPQKQTDATQNSEDSLQTANDDNQNGNLQNANANLNMQSVSSSDYVRGSLILVNAEHVYDFDRTGADIPNQEIITVASNIQNKNFKAADYNVLLAKETVDALNAMFADFSNAGGSKDVMINSAYRTFEQQQNILESKKEQLGENQQIAQTPGNSEHHTGYAFDFSIYPDGGAGARTFTKEERYAWIYENCHKYGFVLRYPEGKSSVTGIAPESWHFRYVGIPHATYMFEKNLTLEEYISGISVYSQNLPLTVSVSETESWNVFYVPKSENSRTEFYVPQNVQYKISGNNADGFVVWYKTSDSENFESSDNGNDANNADENLQSGN